MIRALATLIMLTAGLLCAGQDRSHRESDLLFDISAAVKSGTLKFQLGHAISDHWTLEAGAGVCLSKTGKRETEDERIHKDGLESGEVELSDLKVDMYSGFICATYWPTGTHKGFHINAGCCMRDHKDIDMTLGAGYCIRIWRGLALRIFSRLEVAASYKNGKAEGELLSLGIGYIF